MIIVALGLTVIFVFIGVAALTAASANSLQTFAKIYKDRFTESADIAASDMFLTMNPVVLFSLNMLALILIPLLVKEPFCMESLIPSSRASYIAMSSSVSGLANRANSYSDKTF